MENSVFLGKKLEIPYFTEKMRKKFGKNMETTKKHGKNLERIWKLPKNTEKIWKKYGNFQNMENFWKNGRRTAMERYTTIKSFRMDADTLKILDSNVKRMNESSGKKKKMNEAAYIRDLIHRDYQQFLGLSQDDFTKIIRILAGIGNNINQIAHNTNMQVFNLYDAERLHQGLNEVSEVKKLLMDIRKKV